MLQAAEASDKLHDIVAPVANRLGAALVPLKSMVSPSSQFKGLHNSLDIHIECILCHMHRQTHNALYIQAFLCQNGKTSPTIIAKLCKSRALYRLSYHMPSSCLWKFMRIA